MCRASACAGGMQPGLHLRPTSGLASPLASRGMQPGLGVDACLQGHVRGDAARGDAGAQRLSQGHAGGSAPRPGACRGLWASAWGTVVVPGPRHSDRGALWQCPDHRRARAFWLRARARARAVFTCARASAQMRARARARKCARISSIPVQEMHIRKRQV